MKFSLRLIIPFIAALLVVLFFGHCKKEKLETIHENLIIDSNAAPPYNGVTTLQIENYINKMYIDLAGRESSASEMAQKVDFLKQNKLSETARVTVIESIMASDDYHQRLFEINSSNMIQGADSVIIDEQAQLFAFVIDFLLQNGDTLSAQVIELDLIRLTALQNAKSDFRNGAINISKYISRFINNSFYDEINMGTENFVKATFEDLFFRSPTSLELVNAKKMVDSQSSQIFLQDGNSKTDYIQIVTNTSEFYQGLVAGTFQILLVRNPTSLEVQTYSEKIKTTGKLESMQKEIIKSKEYAGF